MPAQARAEATPRAAEEAGRGRGVPEVDEMHRVVELKLHLLVQGAGYNLLRLSNLGVA